jgi:hypothetical protein
MTEELFDFVMYFSIGIQFLPFLLLMFIKNKALVKLKRALLVLSLIHIVTDITALICAPIFENNNPIYRVYTIVTGTVVLYVFHILCEGKWIRKVIQISYILFLGCAIFLFFHNQGYLTNDVIPSSFLCVLAIFLSIYYFYNLSLDMYVKNLLENSSFWIVSSLLIYYGTIFYLTLFEDFIRTENSNLLYYIWPILFVSTIIYNLILARGIWEMKS